MIRIFAIFVTLSVAAVLTAPFALRLLDGTGGIAQLMQAGRDTADKGDWVEARLRYEQVLSKDPENLEARLGLARALRDGGLYELSATHLLHIIGKDPQMSAPRVEFAEMLFMAGHLSESRLHLDKALVTEGDLLPRARALSAALAATDGDDAQAVTLAKAALADDPGLSSAYATLVGVVLRTQDFDGALDILDDARAAGADTLPLGLTRLGILEQLDRLDEIGPELRALADAYPDAPELRLALARWLIERQPDRPDAAREILVELVRDKARDRVSMVTLTSDVAEILGTEGALDVLQAAASDPENEGALETQIAVLQSAGGDTAGGKARLTQQIKDGETPEARNTARLLLARLLDPVSDSAARIALANDVLEDDPQNPSAHLLLADAETRAGDQEAAISHLRVVLSVRPDDIATIMALARAHALAGSKELALDRLSKAVQVSNHAPEIALPYSLLIEMRQGSGSAAGLIDVALEAHPESLDLLVRRAALALESGDISTVRTVRARLIDMPGGTAAVAELDLALAAQSGTIDAQLTELAGNESADGQLRLARTTLRAGRADDAKTVLDALLATAPDNVDALLLRADASLALQDTAGAVADLSRAARLAPERAGIAASLARLYLALKQPDDADAAILTGLTQNPDDYELNVLQAYRLDQTGQSDAARQAFDALARREPGDPRVAFRLARLLSTPDGASNDVTRALQLIGPFDIGSDPERAAIRGWVLHRKGSSEQGLDLLRGAATQSADDPQIQSWLGLAERDAGNSDAALAAVSKALDLAATGVAPVDPAILQAARTAHVSLVRDSQTAQSN